MPTNGSGTPRPMKERPIVQVKLKSRSRSSSRWRMRCARSITTSAEAAGIHTTPSSSNATRSPALMCTPATFTGSPNVVQRAKRRHCRFSCFLADNGALRVYTGTAAGLPRCATLQDLRWGASNAPRRRQQVLARPVSELVQALSRLGKEVRLGARLSPRYWIGRVASRSQSSCLSDALIRSPP